MRYFIQVLIVFALLQKAICQVPTLQLTEIASGFYRPTDIESAGDSRLFISQMNGKIMIYENGQVNPVPFLDISNKIKGGEYQGIFGFCFHPNYVQNGYLYVHYLIPGNEYSRYSRFTRNSTYPNLADSNSEKVIYEVPYPNNGHRSGDFNFGTDGNLYISTGDGAPGARGSVGDLNGNAQNLKSVFGKILRINVDNAQPFSIPATNPYLAPNDDIPDEIWALGLRNPWRWNFDKLNGDIWIGDNGQDGWEEVDYLQANFTGSRNFGWRCFEGTHSYLPANCISLPSLVLPIIDYPGYDNNNQIGASVVGGYVYRGNQFPNLKGWYIYGDYTQGKFWTLKQETQSNAGDLKSNLLINNVLQNITMENPVSFGQDAYGELYVTNFFGGKLYKISDTSLPLPLNLLTFTAKKTFENGVQLTWNTSNESNFSHFEIQKSTNSSIFKTLGIVQSSSTFSKETNNYNFDDNLLNISELNSILYYRLKIVEANGEFHFSNIIRLYLNLENKTSSKFYPNPIDNNTLYIDLNSKKSTIVNFKIYGSNAKLIQNKIEHLHSGFNKISLDFSLITSGIYIIKYEIDRQIIYEKIVVK